MLAGLSRPVYRSLAQWWRHRDGELYLVIGFVDGITIGDFVSVEPVGRSVFGCFSKSATLSNMPIEI